MKFKLEDIINNVKIGIVNNLKGIKGNTPYELFNNYIKKDKDIYSIISKDDNKKNLAYKIVEDTYNKYKKFLKGSYDILHKLAKGISYSGDAGIGMVYTGNALGLELYAWAKPIAGLLDLPDKLYSIWYGIRTGNYGDTLRSLGEYFISIIPGLTVFNEGTYNIIKKRIINESIRKIKNEFGLYDSKNIINPIKSIKEIYNKDNLNNEKQINEDYKKAA